MRALIALTSIAMSLVASAAEPEVIHFNLSTRIGDAPPVTRQIAVGFGSEQRVPAAGSLGYHIVARPGLEGHVVVSVLLEDSERHALPRTEIGLRLAAGATRAVSFAVCGDRIILQDGVVASAARCGDLLPMATVDPRPDGCIECVGAYEGMPLTFAARARIAPKREPGEPLVLTGRTLGPDGVPRPGVIVYAFQTDRTGIYPDPKPVRSTLSQMHGRLRGWVRTDAEGRYTIDTIRPGAYPEHQEPEHIHMVVIEPGCSTYFIEDVHFTDDPLLDEIKRAKPEYSKALFNGRGGSGTVIAQRDETTGVLHATRDIELGRNFTDYPGCTPRH